MTEGHVVQVVAVGQTPGSVAGVCVVGVGLTPGTVTGVCVVVLDNLVL